MTNNKTFKQQVKDWWNDNKSAIKAGFVFGLMGAFYGMAIGTDLTNRTWLEAAYKSALNESKDEDDELGSTDDGYFKEWPGREEYAKSLRNS